MCLEGQTQDKDATDACTSGSVQLEASQQTPVTFLEQTRWLKRLIEKLSFNRMQHTVKIFNSANIASFTKKSGPPPASFPGHTRHQSLVPSHFSLVVDARHWKSVSLVEVLFVEENAGHIVSREL